MFTSIGSLILVYNDNVMRNQLNDDVIECTWHDVIEPSPIMYALAEIERTCAEAKKRIAEESAISEVLRPYGAAVWETLKEIPPVFTGSFPDPEGSRIFEVKWMTGTLNGEARIRIESTGRAVITDI